MGKPLSKDLRERIVTAYENGEGSQAELAKRFVVSQSGISRLLKHQRETGSLDARKSTGRPSKIQEKAYFIAFVNTHPDATLCELAEAYSEQTGKSVSFMSIQRSLNRFALTRKKKSL